MRVSFKQKLKQEHAGQFMDHDHRTTLQMAHSELSSELAVSDLTAAGKGKPTTAERRR